MQLDFAASNNEAFYPLFHDTHRYQILKGGAGSGKSHYVAQRLIYRCLVDPIDHKFLIVRKTSPAVRESCFALIDGYLRKWNLPHKTTYLKIEFEGNVFLFKGCDDPEKLKSIEGITGIWVEEATGLDAKDFQQLDLRLRGDIGTYKQIILSFNPIGGKSTWLYRRFFDVVSPDALVHNSTWRDNKFIDAEYAAQAIQTGDEHFQAIYDRGEWSELKNAIYSNLYKVKMAEADVLHHLEVADHIYCGVDFGFNDPSVCLLITERDQDIFILRELYKTKLTNAEFITQIKAMLPGELVDIPFYCDSAEPARIREFVQEGLSAVAADKKVHDGIDEVKRRKICINTECTNTCEELPLYSYKEDRDGNVLEEPVKFHDHTADAARYGVYSTARKGIVFYAGKDEKEDV